MAAVVQNREKPRFWEERMKTRIHRVLEASALFRNPAFLGTTREKDGLMFRMTCEVSKGALE